MSESALLAAVAARARRLRMTADLTQEAMAERFGCTLRHYQRMETGEANMSLRTIARLAEALSVHPARLLSQAPADARRRSIRARKCTRVSIRA